MRNDPMKDPLKGNSPAIREEADLTFDGQARCTATSKRSGERCGRAARPGMGVCISHGGGSMQAKKAAYIRLTELVEPAINTLADIMEDKTAKDGDRLRAADSLLDRFGISRRSQVDDDTARALLVTRLMEMAQGTGNSTEGSPDDPIEAEIVEEAP